jgi:hypothetical protein
MIDPVFKRTTITYGGFMDAIRQKCDEHMDNFSEVRRIEVSPQIMRFISEHMISQMRYMPPSAGLKGVMKIVTAIGEVEIDMNKNLVDPTKAIVYTNKTVDMLSFNSLLVEQGSGPGIVFEEPPKFEPSEMPEDEFLKALTSL